MKKDIPSLDLSTYALLTRAGGIAHAQPAGLWRDRGAGPLALRVGVGLVPSGRKKLRATDDQGNTLWHYWAEGPHPAHRWKAWRAVLDARDADQVNARHEHPLHRLAIRGQAAAIRVWGQDMGWPQDLEPALGGDTILHRAAWSGDAATLQAVLEHTASLDEQNEEGHTPLTIAVHRGGLAAIEPLLVAGADPNVRDARGRTAMHHAAEHGDPALLDRIEEFGGDRDWADAIGRTADELLLQRMELDARRVASAHRYWTRLFEQRQRD